MGCQAARSPRGPRQVDLPATARPDFASVNVSEPGLATRIGLADTLTGPDGRLASGNAELARLAMATWTAAAAP